jgi:hypothetical protein
MSRVRVHNFSISLDGFATGEGQAAETPFGHAGMRLAEWLFATRFGREMLGEAWDRRYGAAESGGGGGRITVLPPATSFTGHGDTLARPMVRVSFADRATRASR